MKHMDDMPQKNAKFIIQNIHQNKLVRVSRCFVSNLTDPVNFLLWWESSSFMDRSEYFLDINYSCCTFM